MPPIASPPAMLPSQWPPATLVLVGASVLVYLAMNALDWHAIARALLISAYTQPLLPEIRDGQLWRLATPIFLHFNIFHLVFNMLWTWELGRVIEARHGALALLGLTAALGVASNLGQYYASGPLFGGMSGVIYGYFGYLWMQGRFNRSFGVQLRPPIIYLLLGWFALCWSGLFEILFGLSVANIAHAGGLASGMVLALTYIALQRLVRGASSRRHSK